MNIPHIDEEVVQKHLGPHFKIEYKLATKSFWIKDLGRGFGSFFKLKEKKKLVLKNQILLNIGLNFFKVEI